MGNSLAAIKVNRRARQEHAQPDYRCLQDLQADGLPEALHVYCVSSDDALDAQHGR